jgi:hypothetical protein
MAWIDQSGLHVKGASEVVIPSNNLRSAELFRLHGLGRVSASSITMDELLLAVVRLMIRQFAFINFFKTGQLQKELAAIASLNVPGSA